MTTPFFNFGVMLDEATLHPEDLNLDTLWATAERWERYANTTDAELLDRVQDAELIVTNKVHLDATLLNGLHNAKLICIAATGTNNVDIQAASDLNIPVCNVTGYATSSVVEHTFSLILSLRRRLFEHQQAAIQQWPQAENFSVLDYSMHELKGQTLGIIGCGELGSAVAALARAFGMRVIISKRPGATNDFRPDRLPLSTVLSTADVISLHCPLTSQTENLINATTISLMKPGALLINTARGGIVDETALLKALKSGHLGGAALDVLASEPPSADHPLLTCGLTNLILTPHVAWASQESRQRLVDEMVKNIKAFTRGEKRNRLDAGSPTCQ